MRHRAIPAPGIIGAAQNSRANSRASEYPHRIVRTGAPDRLLGAATDPPSKRSELMLEIHAAAQPSKASAYRELRSQWAAVLADERNGLANTANLSSLIFHGLPGVSWAGFYFLQGGELVLGPFQGKVACVRIGLDEASVARLHVRARPSSYPTSMPFQTILPVMPRRARSWSSRSSRARSCWGFWIWTALISGTLMRKTERASIRSWTYCSPVRI